MLLFSRDLEHLRVCPDHISLSKWTSHTVKEKCRARNLAQTSVGRASSASGKGVKTRLHRTAYRHAIQGHAPKTVGDEYGEPQPDAVYPKILGHPKHDVVTAKTVDRRRGRHKG